MENTPEEMVPILYASLLDMDEGDYEDVREEELNDSTSTLEKLKKYGRYNNDPRILYKALSILCGD